MSQIEAISTLSALKQALEALEYIDDGANNQGAHTGISWRCVSNKAQPAITSLRQAIDAASQLTEAAVAEQHEKQSTKCVEQGEPVFWWNGGTQFATQKSKDWDKRTGGTTAFGCDIPLYTTPYVPEGRQQRTWVGLTYDERVSIIDADENCSSRELCERIEKKLKEKNT